MSYKILDCKLPSFLRSGQLGNNRKLIIWIQGYMLGNYSVSTSSTHKEIKFANKLFKNHVCICHSKSDLVVWFAWTDFNIDKVLYYTLIQRGRDWPTEGLFVSLIELSMLAEFSQVSKYWIIKSLKRKRL